MLVAQWEVLRKQGNSFIRISGKFGFPSSKHVETARNLKVSKFINIHSCMMVLNRCALAIADTRMGFGCTCLSKTIKRRIRTTSKHLNHRSINQQHASIEETGERISRRYFDGFPQTDKSFAQIKGHNGHKGHKGTRSSRTSGARAEHDVQEAFARLAQQKNQQEPRDPYNFLVLSNAALKPDKVRVLRRELPSFTFRGRRIQEGEHDAVVVVKNLGVVLIEVKATPTVGNAEDQLERVENFVYTLTRALDVDGKSTKDLHIAGDLDSVGNNPTAMDPDPVGLSAQIDVAASVSREGTDPDRRDSGVEAHSDRRDSGVEADSGAGNLSGKSLHDPQAVPVVVPVVRVVMLPFQHERSPLRKTSHNTIVAHRDKLQQMDALWNNVVDELVRQRDVAGCCGVSFGEVKVRLTRCMVGLWAMRVDLEGVVSYKL